MKKQDYIEAIWRMLRELDETKLRYIYRILIRLTRQEKARPLWVGLFFVSGDFPDLPFQ